MRFLNVLSNFGDAKSTAVSRITITSEKPLPQSAPPISTLTVNPMLASFIGYKFIKRLINKKCIYHAPFVKWKGLG